MILEYFYLLNVFMISRLVYFRTEEKLSRKKWIQLISIVVVGLLPFQYDIVFLFLCLVIVLDGFILFLLERKIKQLELMWIVNILILAIILTFFFTQNYALQFNQYLPDIIQKMKQFCLFPASISYEQLFRLNILVLGLLLVTNESSLIVRAFFSQMDMAPGKKPSDKKNIEENTVEKIKQKSWFIKITEKLLMCYFVLKGNVNSNSNEKEKYDKVPEKMNDDRSGRIIGIIERLLMYYFILNGEVASIAFIIAVKGFARFKELDNRAYAEYVLIGTLLSTLLAVIVSNLVISLLPQIIN